MKKYFLLTFTTVISCFGFSQNQINNWFFGDSIMMNFVSGIITASQIDAPNLLPIQEASASISDSAGNLLFYTDGKYVWNRNNEIMPNGCCLDIDQYWAFASSVTQGVIIIPKPGYENEYNIFILSENGFSYSTVDMNLDGGFGDLIIKDETLINNEFTEQMHAIKHANGRDWWVLAHEERNDPDSSTLFYKIFVAPDTIILSTQETGIKREGNHWGQMIFSPDGSRLAYADKNGLEIFDFDRCSGELEQLYFIPIEDIAEDGLYGCAFSPDGSKLYTSTVVDNTYSQMFQYCFNCNDPFPETKKLIYELVVEYYIFWPKYTLGQLQLGPDGKVYIDVDHTIMPNDVFSEYNMNLCVINLPNEEIACDVDTNSIALGGRRALLGLPNFPNYNLGALAGSECDTIIEVVINDLLNKSKINIYPNPTTGYVFFKGNFSANQLYNIIITNAQGKKVFIKKDIPLTQKLNISNLPQGIYTISLEQDNVIKFSDIIVITKQE